MTLEMSLPVANVAQLPFKERGHVLCGTGARVVFINAVKTLFGVGLFSVPWVFYKSGWMLATMCVWFAVVLSLEAFRMLTRAQDLLITGCKVPRQDVTTYMGLAERALGSFGYAWCCLAITIACFGIAVSYIRFVVETCSNICPELSSLLLYMFVAPLFCLLSLVRKVSTLTVVSTTGSVSVVLCIAVTILQASQRGLNFTPLAIVSDAIFECVSPVAFIFFVHFTLFDVQTAAPDSATFLSSVRAAYVTGAFIVSIFGLVTSMAFGDTSFIIITALSGIAGTMTKVLMSLNVIFSYPIMARPALQTFEKPSAGNAVGPKSVTRTRILFVLAAILVAALVPDFRVALAIVGGVFACTLSLIFPPVILLSAYFKVNERVSMGEWLRILAVLATGVWCIFISFYSFGVSGEVGINSGVKG